MKPRHSQTKQGRSKFQQEQGWHQTAQLDQQIVAALGFADYQAGRQLG